MEAPLKDSIWVAKKTNAFGRVLAVPYEGFEIDKGYPNKIEKKWRTKPEFKKKSSLLQGPGVRKSSRR